MKVDLINFYNFKTNNKNSLKKNDFIGHSSFDKNSVYFKGILKPCYALRENGWISKRYENKQSLEQDLHLCDSDTYIESQKRYIIASASEIEDNYGRIDSLKVKKVIERKKTEALIQALPKPKSEKISKPKHKTVKETKTKEKPKTQPKIQTKPKPAIEEPQITDILPQVRHQPNEQICLIDVNYNIVYRGIKSKLVEQLDISKTAINSALHSRNALKNRYIAVYKSDITDEFSNFDTVKIKKMVDKFKGFKDRIYCLDKNGIVAKYPSVPVAAQEEHLDYNILKAAIRDFKNINSKTYVKAFFVEDEYGNIDESKLRRVIKRRFEDNDPKGEKGHIFEPQRSYISHKEVERVLEKEQIKRSKDIRAYNARKPYSNTGDFIKPKAKLKINSGDIKKDS